MDKWFDEIDQDVAKEIVSRDILDSRNVRDEFKGLPTETIREVLPHTGLRVAISNRMRDFNLASIVRSCNILGVKDITIAGPSKRWDKRGAVGAQHYSSIIHSQDMLQVIDDARADGYRIVALEYDERYEMSSIYNYEWAENTLLIVGEEGPGLPSDVLDKCDDIVYIPMIGALRSFNAASAFTSAGVLYNQTWIYSAK